MLNDYIGINNNKLAYRIIDGEVVIIDLKDNKLHVLNPVATFIWEHLDGQTQIKDIVKKISKEFDVDSDTAERDCIDVISDLKKKNLVFHITFRGV